VRVLVWPADYGGCAEYRLLQPARVVKDYGIETKVDRRGPVVFWDVVWKGEHPPPNANVMGLARKPEADVIVMQRPGRKYWAQLIPFLQEAGIRIVVDIDDDFDHIHPANVAYDGYDPKCQEWHHRGWVHEACKLADLVTVTTPALRDSFGHGHGRVIPNFVPSAYLDINDPTPLHAVGWAGSIDSHPTDLQVTRGAVPRALRGTGWGLHVVGMGDRVAKALGMGTPTISSTGWVDLSDYPTRLAEIGVGIVPLEDSAFNHAKSGLKLMEMASVGVPTVASPTPDNVRLNRLGVGELAASPRKWERTIRALIESEGYRAEVAGRSREAMKALTYEANAELWVKAWTGR
jgi:hypothetical protein